jgi:hypothetical protein
VLTVKLVVVAALTLSVCDAGAEPLETALNVSEDWLNVRVPAELPVTFATTGMVNELLVAPVPVMVMLAVLIPLGRPVVLMVTRIAEGVVVELGVPNVTHEADELAVNGMLELSLAETVSCVEELEDTLKEAGFPYNTTPAETTKVTARFVVPDAVITGTVAV